MTTSTPQPPHDEQLAELETDFPSWSMWRGVGASGWYARRLKTSPPCVVQAATPAELRLLVVAEELRRSTR
jgi:hypothetical protein